MLDYDGEPQPARDEAENVITLWDRRSTRTDLVTNRNVPDETKRVPLLTYANPRPATWPEADYIVGNPPFIGTARMREDLGDGYAETLRAAYPEMPESADFVLYWWHKAAGLVRRGKAKRFGLITTNSLRQTFARRVVQMHLTPRSGDLQSPTKPNRDSGTKEASGSAADAVEGTTAIANRRSLVSAPLSLVFAIPDHPWVDTAEGAAVRIAMTVGVAGEQEGELLEVIAEEPHDDGSSVVKFAPAKRGRISSDLTAGANIATAIPLMANYGLANPGVQLSGQGFVVTPDELASFPATARESLFRRYITGRDLMQESRDQYVIDTIGLTAEELRTKYPEVFQRLYDRVRPERLTNSREKYRNEWWIHAEPRTRFREALKGLNRFVVTSRTARHRVFQFASSEYLPESKVLVLGFDDGFALGVLSSRIHVLFANAAGGWLGVGNDSTYNHSDCLEKFPFPLCGEAEKARIRALAEEIDAHRKRVQAQHGLTLTGLYNVLEKLRALEPRRGDLQSPSSLNRDSGKNAASPSAADAERASTAITNRRSLELTDKERDIHDKGLVSLLKQLHDDLDAAVFAAYGWPANLTDAEILERLVALNAERAAEEQRGIIRWLRPDYQNPQGSTTTQDTLELPEEEVKTDKRKVKGGSAKAPWPKPLADRIRATEQALHATGVSVTAADLTQRFSRASEKDVHEILESLVALGRAHRSGEKFSA